MKVGKKNPFAFSAPLYCYKIIVLHITFHLPPKIFHVSTNFFSIRVCSVGGKIERMKKERERERERERKWLGEVFDWKGEEEGILVEHRNFLPDSSKQNLPKLKRKLCKKFWTKMPTSKPTVYVLLPIVSYSFFFLKKKF